MLLTGSLAWTQPYVISTVAGGVGPPTPIAGVNAGVGAVSGIAVDGAGNVYFSSGLACVFKLDSKGTLTLFAGDCRPGYAGDGGPATSAQVFKPAGLATDSSGNVYIADAYPSDRIRKVSPSGIITTFAGSGISGYSGDGGPATSAAMEITGPPPNSSSLATDPSGNVYVAEWSSQRIRMISASTGIITTVAGNGKSGFSGDGGPATSAELRYPTGVAVDAQGNLYIADTENYRVRKVTSAGVITTVAGTGSSGAAGDGGAAVNATLDPYSIAIDTAGNLFITDTTNARVRKISTAGVITTVAGGGPGGSFSFGGDGGPATSANLNQPLSAAVDSAGNLYIADQNNFRVRKVSTTGTITTVAGNGTAFSGDGGPATSAQLYFSSGVAVDPAGNLYIGDTDNHRVRKVSASGVITTLAGNGSVPASTGGAPGPAPGAGGPATSAPLYSPIGVALDSAGNVYFSDYATDRVHKVSSAGIITTVAGNGTLGSSGDGGQAVNAQLGAPEGIALDSGGNLYIAETQTRKVRKVSPAGIISTVAGNGVQGYTGDGGPAVNAALNEPIFVAVDSNGGLYIADLFACVVRKVTPDGTISTFAGNGNCNPSAVGGDGGPATSASFAPYGIAVDAAGDLFIADDATVRIRMVSAASGIMSTIAGQSILDGFPGNCSGDGGIATQAQITSPQGVAVDLSGNVYFGDVLCNSVRKLTPEVASALTLIGNNQTGQVGWTLAYPLQVVVNGGAGVPVPGVTVNFAVTSGSGSLSASSAVTDNTGTVAVQLTLGATPGNIIVTATVAGLPPAQFTATAIAAPSNGNITCTLSSAPAITSLHSLDGWGGFPYFAPGGWIEIIGSNLGVDARTWATADFQGPNAPTSLDTTSVSIDGNAGFVEYVSGGQINVVAPADSNTGPVKVTVTTCAGTSAPATLPENAVAPGMLAPSIFFVPGNPPELVPDKQYLDALFTDGTFVGKSGLYPGLPFRPAQPGDLIIAYGIGFGPVTPGISPGVVVGQANSVPNVSISFGQTPAQVMFAGLVQGSIGLYQFNIIVPQVAAGDYQINVSVGGAAVPQTLYLTVQ